MTKQQQNLIFVKSKLFMSMFSAASMKYLENLDMIKDTLFE